jgi:GTP-binding protein HflX
MERVITVGVQLRGQEAHEIHSSLEELERLVETAGGHVIESHIQKRDRPDPAVYVGKGKAVDLDRAARRLGVKTIVFDEELKPNQQRNLEEATNTKIIDRTRLILDIFARRARTREGKLQVELAQIAYLLPRLTERFGRFEQQVGGIGTRGPGERKLEVDRRRMRDRMTALKKELEKVRDERAQQRAVRQSVPVPQVALVGYTNAGKSTLLNRLLAASAGAPKADRHRVYADDKLFATLDPTTRRIKLPSGRVVLFTDTVGFIRKLPTELVAAFRATLEETASADLLVHVIDASDPGWEEQVAAVSKIVKDLHMDRLPVLLAYNKMDRLSPTQKGGFAKRGGFLVSAGTGAGIHEFLQAVESALSRQWIEKDIFVPYTDRSRLALIHEHTDILAQEATDRGVQLRIRSHPATFAQIFRENPHHDARQ